MGKSQETFSKKEKEKKRLRKKKEKLERKAERKANSQGGALEDMIAYVDEFGNISETPPDPTKKKEEVDPSKVQLGAAPREEDEPLDTERRGRVAFFNDSKGYGFINQDGTQERFFVHVNGTTEPIQEGDRVSFQLEQGPKGLNAVRVKKV